MFRGGLEFDVVTRAMYATDASLYEIRPLGVAYPQDREDVAVLARYASENDIPLIPRGAGTGLAGGAVGTGLTVDFSRHMTRIESIGTDSVRVQTGVVLNVLNRALRETGRYFPPDPSNAAVTTIGGACWRSMPPVRMPVAWGRRGTMSKASKRCWPTGRLWRWAGRPLRHPPVACGRGVAVSCAGRFEWRAARGGWRDTPAPADAAAAESAEGERGSDSGAATAVAAKLQRVPPAERAGG